MKKFTFLKKKDYLAHVPMAVGFLISPTFFYAQSAKEKLAIKEKTDLQALQMLKSDLRKNTLTTKQLQSKAREKGLVFSGESKGRMFQLKGFDKKSGKPIYYITNNAGASYGTGTSKLNSSAGIFNLDGEGMKVYEWDGGAVNVTHREFGGRATQKDTPASTSSHSTHVAGTMVASGIDPKAKGMAPKATLDAYDWTDDEIEMVAAAADGAILSNHSYGYLSGFVWGDYSGMTGWHWIGEDEDTEYKLYGKYTETDRDWDIIALNAPFYLPVKAGGNPRGDGPEPGETHYVQIYNDATQKWEWRSSTKVRQKNGGEFGYDSVNQGGVGKNILIVGAVEKINNGYRDASDVKMASFSAFGPVDDGRIKPDISGIGVGIYSTNTGGVSAYTSMNGTSMASPNVTGSLVLLQEHYKKANNGTFMKAATLKALIIGTANEAGDTPGPDYKSGWGLLNAYRAASAISTNGKYTFISERKLDNTIKDTITVKASGSEPLVATISWTDPAPKDLPTETELNDRRPTLVNDLDIRIKKNGQEFFPWKLDPTNPAKAASRGDNKVDNVEQVVIEKPEPGALYEIEIFHKASLKKNKLSTDADGNLIVQLEDAGSQDYSLVVTGISNNVKQDLSINKISIKASTAQYDEQTPVEFDIENKGAEAASGGKLKYQLVNTDTGETVTTGSEDLAVISAGQTVKAEAKFDLSRSFINYKITGQVLLPGDEVSINDKDETSLYGVVADLRPDNSSHTFGFEDNFEKNGWISQDINMDGSTWRKYDSSGLAYKGNSFAINLSNGVKGTNDWLYSNPLKVSAGKLYRVVINTRKFQELEESLGIYWGTQPNASAMATPIVQNFSIADLSKYNKNYFEFTVPTDQTIYVGFNHKADANVSTYAAALDEVSVQHAETKPVVDFSASKVNINTFETITFKDETLVASTQPVLSRQWTFTPATVEFKDGTTETSANPKVRFTAEGTYQVSLKVSNTKGESETIKSAYIIAKNTAAKAGFNAAVTSIFEGEQITFKNSSTGNPVPSQFKWTITPSDGVEFVNSNEGSVHPTVKFNKMGTYSVSLEAKSEINSNTATKQNFITVNRIHNEVRNLTKKWNPDSTTVQLTWQRPIMNAMYQESFENDANTSGLTVINVNQDPYTWIPLGSGYKGKAIASLSWFYSGPFDADDWLVTPKMRAGAEAVRFMLKVQYPERYDFYVVEAPSSGLAPTIEELKKGTIFLTDEAKTTFKDYTLKEFNIKNLTQKDFYLAFHHRTKATDDGSAIIIDELEVGYDNKLSSTTNSTTGNTNINGDYKAVIKEGKKILTAEDLPKPILPSGNILQQYGFLNLPRLTGYRIEKNDIQLADKQGIENRFHTDSIDKNGTYTYKVYGVYSDGQESEPVSISIDIATLSTSETADGDNIKIYPNPSDGHFVIETNQNISSLKAEIYDFSGRLIHNRQYKGNRVELNLMEYSKGIFILKLTDNNGKQQTAKLIVK